MSSTIASRMLVGRSQRVLASAVRATAPQQQQQARRFMSLRPRQLRQLRSCVHRAPCACQQQQQQQRRWLSHKVVQVTRADIDALPDESLDVVEGTFDDAEDVLTQQRQQVAKVKVADMTLNQKLREMTKGDIGSKWYFYPNRMVASIIEHKDHVNFYEACAVPHTFAGELAVSTLHIWMVKHRLKEIGVEDSFYEGLFETCWLHFNQALREEGVGTAELSRTLRKLQTQLYGTLLAYDHSYRLSQRGDDAPFLGALFRNVYMSDPDTDRKHLRQMLE